ncbi:DEAD/DEAH box helicase [Candidatus Woesearchaeota archaeon]|jgi:helicase|nr:DEAD/DEAH box helicase [Candidatus Woesearchaeota archaeon]MBT5396661.1 DEAD/DEAH box helicase [Candidatus Woesearchaeota archaeon]MBT5924265.1 DEAD/DEAH box helicase [Candidatus Woesearchaeota archaeon]MBT6367552.1 DEAD/DEAH box helicase [Candidatus Woesearchaeota archaeon]MBT7763051.1 DEAD/DEAH box helicase [Candidatus Woesearchaeota archaeon]
MKIQDIQLPDYFTSKYAYPSLTPIQEKSVQAGLLDTKTLLVSAPTASGKTLVATMAIVNTLPKGKAIYLVPLKALANEKYKEYKALFEGTDYSVIMATGDIDSESGYLSKYDVLILTTEKLDSLLRHHVPWLADVKTVIVDEIHLLNDPRRGPTLEVILTLLKTLIKPQIIGLSATIGNPKELAEWLGAELVQDTWRPVELKQGIHHNLEIKFY